MIRFYKRCVKCVSVTIEDGFVTSTSWFLLIVPLVEWSKWTFISDETVIPTLVTISNITQGRDGVWQVTQDFSPKPNFNFAMFKYEFNSTTCRGIIR